MCKHRLEVICGPMFAGKTEELIRRVKRATFAKQKIFVFKPQVDNRYTGTTILSHAKTNLELATGIAPIIISEPSEVYNFDVKGADLVAFDEAQFYHSVTFLKVVRDLLGYTRVICAGLDLDRDGNSFGPMPDLLALADEVMKVKAVCLDCGKDASRTFWKLSEDSKEQVSIGGANEYESKCLPCWYLGREKKLNSNSST